MALSLILADFFHFVDDGQYGATSIPSIETVGSLALAPGFIGEACRNIARHPIRMTNICGANVVSI